MGRLVRCPIRAHKVPCNASHRHHGAAHKPYYRCYSPRTTMFFVESVSGSFVIGFFNTWAAAHDNSSSVSRDTRQAVNTDSQHRDCLEDTPGNRIQRVPKSLNPRAGLNFCYGMRYKARLSTCPSCRFDACCCFASIDNEEEERARFPDPDPPLPPPAAAAAREDCVSRIPTLTTENGTVRRGRRGDLRRSANLSLPFQKRRRLQRGHICSGSGGEASLEGGN